MRRPTQDCGGVTGLRSKRPSRRAASKARASSKKIPNVFASLAEAHAGSAAMFAISVDPELLADRLRSERDTSIAVDIARRRAWLDSDLADTLAGSDGDFEHWLAWLFPTGGRSSADPAAPVIGRREMRALGPQVSEPLARSFDRVLIVLGLVEREAALQWREQETWASRPRQDRRVYRMLRSLHTAGLERQAGLLMAFMEVVAQPAALAWYRHQVAS